MVLPKASCGRCEGAISVVEATLMNADFEPARIHFGLAKKSAKRNKQKLKLGFAFENQPPTQRYLHKDEHPSALVIPDYDHPGIMRGAAVDEPFSYRYLIRSLIEIDDFKKRLAHIGASAPFGTRSPLHFVLFGRMLAKIAHALTVAEVGLDKFTPCLTDIILNGSMHGFKYYIGTLGESRPAPTMHNAKIGMRIDREHLMVYADIQLFSSAASAITYRVFSGSMK